MKDIRSKKRKFSCLLSLCSATILNPVIAKDSDLEQLEPLVVQASALSSSLTSLSLPEAKAELMNVGGGTELVSADRYEIGRASTTADTFFLSPGVVAQPRFGSDEARLSVRGSGLQRTFHGRGITVMQDGVPLNLADGGFDMQSLEPTATRYIQVWRGANALAYGSSTLGGAMNYVSRTGRDSSPFVRVEAGSYDYLRSTFGVGGKSGAVDAYVTGTEYYNDGFRDHATQHNQRAFANIGYQVSDSIETRVYLTAVLTDSELPGSLTKAELKSNPSKADDSRFGSVAHDNHRDYSLYRIGSATTLKSDNTSLRLIAALTHKDLDHPITPFVGVIDQNSNDWLLGSELKWSGDILETENNWTLGVRYTQGTTDYATFANNFGSRGALTSLTQQVASNLEIYTEDRISLSEPLSLLVGFSYAQNTRENKQKVGTAASYDRDYNQLSPKVGLIWEKDGIQLFTNVSASYEPPSFSETNSSLAPNKAQEAITGEIGTRGTKGFFGWDLSLYHARIQNEFLSLNDASGTPLGTTNANDTTHTGVELGIEADLLGSSLNGEKAQNRIMLRGAWTYGLFEFDNDPTYGDKKLAGLPPHLIRGELLWEHAKGWYAGPTLEWVPEKSYIDHTNTFSADAYALAGFKFGCKKEKALSWFIEAKNLTNEEYAATHGVIANAAGADTRQFLSGDGRSIFAGIEWNW
jgi:iron complex outermembrane receptor protein